MGPTGPIRLLGLIGLISLLSLTAHAQIKIGGNVYGGGNHAEVQGSTRVTVLKGNIGAVMDPNQTGPLDDPAGKVFGGARMANVGGSSFVNIDGENATGYILINQVFGGNDIAGTIGTAAAVGENIPTELTAVKKTEADATNYTKNAVDNTFNSYVRISSKVWINGTDTVKYSQDEVTNASTNPDDPAYGKIPNKDVKPDPNAKRVYIGQLFGGGNGDFDYVQTPGPTEGKVTHTIYNWSDKNHEHPIAQVETDEGGVGFQLPEQNKTYLEIKGGSIVYGYGGGNNATVKTQNIIHIDNPSAVVNHILVDADGNEGTSDIYATYETNKTNGTNELPTGYTDLLTTDRFKEMGINTTFSFPSSGAFQIGRFFGGNNKAEMSIMPTWNLLAGKVRNLYSGGNRGSMTSRDGLLLEIMPYSSLIVDNLYGGCRMADVKPTVNGEYVPCTNLQDKDSEGNLKYHFPSELSARVLVKGGHINNVYGGNDVTGTVYGGNAVGIHTTVYGDVYGGGNGAYPYTELESLKDDPIYGDFYFGDKGSDTEALNAFRPNAEQVSVRLAGTAESQTIIKGSVFVGGNCASLATKKTQPLVELKIGSYVTADKVFLGNNGEKMVDPSLLGLYKSNSGISLTDKSVFASYMDGVVMPLKPNIVFDNTGNGDAANYLDNTSMIGSFYGGGNKGSMAVSGKTTLKFDRKLIIFNKLVGGCNDANVEAGEYNAAYEGGLLGSEDERESYTEGGKIKDRIELNLDNVVIRPQRWNDTFKKITSGKLTAGKEYYETDLHETKFIADGSETPTTENPYYELETIGTKLVWNTVKWDIGEDDFIGTGTDDSDDDLKRRLIEGSVYGGCYNSGHVNGNVVININQDLVERDVIFAQTTTDPYVISGERRSGVLKEAQGDDVQSSALAVYGGGYGEDTEIWGSATINHNNGYAFQLFGGGEQGVVGKKNAEGNYVYNAAYSTTVNLKGINAGYSEEIKDGLPIPESEYIYGGGNEGDVLGDSYVYLGNGRIYDAFGGASNADIYGGTEVHIGYNGGFPWVRDNVYGGNDFGGTVRGNRNQYMVTSRPVFEDALKRSSTYVRYIQGRVDSIFGGNYGNYNYADPVFKDYTYSRDEANIPTGLESGAPRLDEEGEPVFTFPHLEDNSFVHFVPEDHSSNFVGYIFGGSAGYPGHESLCNSMQKDTYVLLDDTKTKDVNRFANVDVYGGGAFAGVGTLGDTPENTFYGAGRTVIDLFAGSFHNIYGGCNQEGLVGYTRVNVPAESTANVNALFGGGKGYDIALFKEEATKKLAARYCDNYVTCIDYKGKNAIVNDAIYGGNENCRIACDTYINIEVPVMQSNGYQANIYGAGYGRKTVSGRTNVFMNNGSNAYKVFGGGRDGNAFNFASLRSWLTDQYRTAAGDPEEDVQDKVDAYGNTLNSFKTYLDSNPITLPSTIGTYVNADGIYDGTYTNDILPTTEKPMPDYHQTNVHIMNGGNVSGYAYGGGYGSNAVVAGTTYIELKGGNVDRDIYGGGEGGPVYDEFNLKTFIATTNVNVEGGMTRNVYGGGYEGAVGKHHYVNDDGDIVESPITDSDVNDITAETNVTIGKLDGTSFYNGVPAIMRNAYGGGEGGSVFGSTNLTINNGYIGYRYKNTSATTTPKYEYVEELDDQTPNAIELAGNAFGGGYVINSFVDNANVTMYGGTVRGSLYGGGELGPIGRGTMKSGATGGFENDDAHIYKGGSTYVKLFDGHVLRNVFGGGRGKDSWGGDGTKYMDADLVATLDLKSKGYVFGKTEVDVYGGEVGTSDGVALGYGNVFGAGDVGCVYSATGTKSGVRYGDSENSKEGYYYDNDGNGALTEDCKVLVEPWCKANSAVNINGTAYAAGEYVPTSALNYLGNTIASAADWAALGKTDVNKEGVIIHNAVFAGGNTSPGSTEVFANTPTVFGNATASIHDAYNRDLISIGRGRVGGLYGDGNLTLVDGYRELNITNYGTDFYHINPEITLGEYEALSAREQAYYEIRYKCLKQCNDKDGKTYAEGATITADEMLTVFEGVEISEGVPMLDSDGTPSAQYWEKNGVCSRYAGRPMNTIQRADFCGVFGSRMVMQGAQDRVPETVDYTNYTINRVREVSLNKKVSVRTGDATDANNKEHGNYFGIYSVVNFLGALTSDVDFHTATRTTDNTDADTYGPDYNLAGKVKIVTTPAALEYLKQHPIEGVTINDNNTVWPNTLSGLKSLKSVDGVTIEASRLTNQTYYDWKALHHDERKRNNGSSHNKVALASGVYLELTSEKGTGKGLYEKDWGYITGVVELDLINVQPGVGGGYVYAKNEHGVRQPSGNTQTILTDLNKNNGTPAVTNKIYTYEPTSDDDKKEWETSGNFVHSTQTIIDDCYNIGDRYKGEVKDDGSEAMPAHYWFIKGAVYVYDQYISAYTGSPNAFSEEVSIPLTITSASHGKLTLLNVHPNYYAYYSNGNSKTKIGDGQKITIREKEYGLNDVISYWDYSQLTAHEKAMFEKDTYVTIAECTTKVGTEKYPAGTYPAGTVLLPSEYEALKTANPTIYHVAKEKDVDFDEVFRSSNNVSHNTGYILTYNVDNPNLWNTWYSKVDGSETKNQTGGAGFEDGPTYTPNTSGVYGQNDYEVGNVIPEEEYKTYEGDPQNSTQYPGIRSHITGSNGKQATFKPAYIVTAEVLEATKGTTSQRFHKGAVLANDGYSDSEWSTIYGSVDVAYVATKTVQLSKTDVIYRNTYISKSKYDAIVETHPEIASDIQPAYYCTEEGRYGGNYYKEGYNYRALAAFTAMSPEDRENFTFNYDALDLLVDPNYSGDEGEKYQYDSSEATYEAADNNPAQYSLPTSIDYKATYRGTTSLTYKDEDNNTQTVNYGDILSGTEFESLPNEQCHWAPITVDKAGTYYVVKEVIILGDTPYAAGQVITSDTYNGLKASDKARVVTLTINNAGKYYYCYEDYKINTNDYTGTGKTGAVTDVNTNETYTTAVPAGTIINPTTDGSNYGYSNIINKQTNFSFHGKSPTETSTLYVTRNSDIFDLSKEKIITVIYQYDYVESDMDGMNITPVSERHILNVHLNFESGIPTVEDIRQPDIILPGTALSMPEPYVTPGAYEITGGGWKLFDTPKDAERHMNGVEYTNSTEPLYLYQHDYYLAYYTKTYLGETYSNAVPVSVANYHDLKKVMGDKDHHYYIDHKDVHERLKVEPKIYINDYSGDAEGSKNGLDLFKNLYDLSLLTTPATSGALEGHALLDKRIEAGNKLEFFLRTDIDHSTKPNPDYNPEDPTSPERIPDPWTTIGTDDVCFKGNLHGDGHTISGLDNSLFYNLCGNVYNLGVTGTFTSAGVAEKDKEGKGYIENCWISTSNTAEKTSKPVFGEPKCSDYKQIVNCYYMEEDNATNKYTNHEGTYGKPTRKPAKAFYNGEVAYDLNGFYLYKRYNDGVNTASGVDYKYYTLDASGNIVNKETPLTGYYANNMEQALCSSGYNNIKYVEERFADGDFRYAAGEIPTAEDERAFSETVTNPVTGEETVENRFYPIWPDDYIFFGQKLTYGWAVEEHQDLPTAVAKSEGRISYGNDANRVYRAPAYYRNATMDVAHFNPYAYLAQTKKDVPAMKAYPNMTAIDFKGHSDLGWSLGNAETTEGKNVFYAPLLDDDGLRSIINCDETQNLLAYSPSEADNKKTHDVLNGYFTEPIYNDHYDNTRDYRLVTVASAASVHGHLVQSDKIATNDHLLVDKQDFNAPIAYNFDADHLMWYQRIPADEEYVDLTKGWQGISIPFTAELVTTNQKGEITHFYGGSYESYNDTKTKRGHEYWLREYKNIKEENTDIAKATFKYPEANGVGKTVTNTFLWDYYYQNTNYHNQQDMNADTYEQDRHYYENSRSYSGYSRLAAAKPYIIGFPGETYYEFDLSGKFDALNTAVAIPKLEKQIISFVSDKGAGIGVSDTELTEKTVEYGDGTKYTFKPSYLNTSLEASTNNYALNAAGNSFDKVTETTNVSAFRPYFTAAAVSGNGSRSFFTKKIIFGGTDNDLRDGPETVLDGSLEIYTRGYNIVTTSHMKEATTIRIITAAGAIFSDYVLQPGETIETTVPNTGVYVVNKKKVFVE